MYANPYKVHSAQYSIPSDVTRSTEGHEYARSSHLHMLPLLIHSSQPSSLPRCCGVCLAPRPLLRRLQEEIVRRQLGPHARSPSVSSGPRPPAACTLSGLWRLALSRCLGRHCWRFCCPASRQTIGAQSPAGLAIPACPCQAADLLRRAGLLPPTAVFGRHGWHACSQRRYTCSRWRPAACLLQHRACRAPRFVRTACLSAPLRFSKSCKLTNSGPSRPVVSAGTGTASHRLCCR